MSTDRPATTDPADLIAREVATSIIAAQLTRSWADRVEATRRARHIVAALNRAGYTVAARASEAVRGDGSPTPDVGAARGGEGGSAAESEPRATAKRRILEALDRWHEVGGDTTGEFAGVMEAVDDYAAAIRAAERELVAAQIEAVFVLARRDQSPAEAKADAYRTAAAIARGES